MHKLTPVFVAQIIGLITGLSLLGYAATCVLPDRETTTTTADTRHVSLDLRNDTIPPSPTAAAKHAGKAGGALPTKFVKNASFPAASDNSAPQTRQVTHFSGVIKGSLFEAAAAQGVPFSVMSEVVHVFSYDVDFQRDIQPGDKFEILSERFVDEDGRAHGGGILYASLTLSGERMTAYRYVDSSGNASYYSSKGESLRKGLLKTPVAGADISSGFGMRIHPILGFSMLHKGVDFAVTSGTPVMAAGDGIIEVMGTKSTYGRYVKIRHDEIHATAYAHLSKYAKGLHVGSRVSQGEVFAFSGASGRATGPHLHYEVLVNNAQVNPMKVKFNASYKLDGHELTRFLSTVQATGEQIAMVPVTTKVAMVRTNSGTN